MVFQTVHGILIMLNEVGSTSKFSKSRFSIMIAYHSSNIMILLEHEKRKLFHFKFSEGSLSVATLDTLSLWIILVE